MDCLPPSSPATTPLSQPPSLSNPASSSHELANPSSSSEDLSPKSAASSLESVSSDLESALSASESPFPSLDSRPSPHDPSPPDHPLDQQLLDFHDTPGDRVDWLSSQRPPSSSDDHLPPPGQFSPDSAAVDDEANEGLDVASTNLQEKEGQQRSLSRASSLNAKAPEFIPKVVSAPSLSSPAPAAVSPPPVHSQASPPLMMPLPIFPPSPTITRAPASPLGNLPPPVVGPPPPPIPGRIMGPMPMLGPPPGLLNMQMHAPPPTPALLPPAFMMPSPALSAPGQPHSGHIPDIVVNQSVGVNVESVQARDQPQDLDAATAPAPTSKPVLTDELKAKIVKQVEYYFSDFNLPTDNYLLKFVRKDPEGFVPIPVVASFRRIRNLVKGSGLVAMALRSSKQLVVSDDGKKVRRRHPLPEVDAEEAQVPITSSTQSRTVVAENLPVDHSIASLENLFGTVGNVKMVQICQPEAVHSTNQTSAKNIKTDKVVSNKLHALVEYESVEQAERAVSELTDHRNWRSGLHVRPLLWRMYQGKHVHDTYKHIHKQAIGGRGRKLGDGGDGSGGEEDLVSSLSDSVPEKIGEESLDGAERFDGLVGNDTAHSEKDGGPKKGRGRGRGGGRGRGQFHQNGGRSHPIGTPPHGNSFILTETKPPPGPRMPDGTRGFTTGRGKLMGSSA